MLLNLFFFFNTHQRKCCYVSIRVCSEVIVVFFFFTPPDRSIFTVLLRLQLSKLFSFTVLFFFFYPLSSLHHHNNTTKKKGKEKKNSIFMCCQFKLALYTTQLTVSLCFLSLNRTSFSHIFFFFVISVTALFSLSPFACIITRRKKGSRLSEDAQG